MMTCVTCKERFTPAAGKPGFVNQCWSCGEETEARRGVTPLRNGDSRLSLAIDPPYVPAHGGTVLVAPWSARRGRTLDDGTAIG